jgi:L-alanine-DL-glutamate epimerase-like enolase superfamily enzyme
MKIARIDPVVVNAGLRNWIFVKVTTDQDGLYGWGEATTEWKTRAVVGAIQDLASLAVGRDPRDIEQLCRTMVKRHYWPPGIVGMSAISGIEQALWDIFGKSVGLPVWRLLGGKVRDRVKVYTHLGMGDTESVYRTFDCDGLVDKARELLSKGYLALKVVFIPFTHYGTDAAATRHVGKLMAALRDAVGENVDLMVDFHGRCASISSALAYIDQIAPHMPLFVEEPIQPGDAAAMQRISELARCPIATGERLVGRREFDELFSRRAISIAQPDISHCGGLLEAKKIAAAAETAHIGMAPHNPLGPIAGTVALHFAVSTPNFVIQEEMVGATDRYWNFVKSPIEMMDGHWSVPHAPGLGVEVDEAFARRFPYREEPLLTEDALMPDGTVVDW